MQGRVNVNNNTQAVNQASEKNDENSQNLLRNMEPQKNEGVGTNEFSREEMKRVSST